MPNFCGAWRLCAGPIEGLLRETEKEAMLARFPGGPDGANQVSRGRLWLAAGAGGLRDDGQTCLATDGSIAAAPGGLRGHYSQASADTVHDRLILLRDHTGGRLLFYARLRDLLLFSTAAEVLLAHSGVRRELDIGPATEFLLNGSLFFTSRTLFSGIQQVPPGHMLEVSGGRIELRRHGAPLDGTAHEDPIDTPRKLRQALQAAVGLAIGREPEVAVALSGGLDSSAVAACAAELLGAGNVHAFTYEFQDAEHLSEAPLAEQLCRRLGIRHRAVSISYEDYRDAVLETVWCMEDPSSAVRSGRIALLARAVKDRGLALCLDGFGVEELLGIGWSGYLDNLGRVLPSVPWPERTLRFWQAALAPRSLGWDLLRALARRIPCVKPPPPDLFYIILCALQHNGITRDASLFYPPALRDQVRKAIGDPRLAEAFRGLTALPLRVQLQYLKYFCQMLKVTSTCMRPLAARLGVALTAPAMLLHPGIVEPGFWRASGKDRFLMQSAMAGMLPDDVARRGKIVISPAKFPTVISGSWQGRVMQDIAPLVCASRERLKESLCPGFDSARESLDEDRLLPGYISFGSMNLDLLALWHRLHIDGRPEGQAPRWQDLRP